MQKISLLSHALQLLHVCVLLAVVACVAYSEGMLRTEQKHEIQSAKVFALLHNEIFLLPTQVFLGFSSTGFTVVISARVLQNSWGG